MRVQDRDVVLTGSVVCHAGDSRVALAYGPLQFNILFVDDPSKPALVTAEPSGVVLDIELQNFQNSLGLGWSGEVGYLKNETVFLAIFVHAVGDEKAGWTRLLNFTFSTKVKND